jgi:hypothetical protein
MPRLRAGIGFEARDLCLDALSVVNRDRPPENALVRSIGWAGRLCDLQNLPLRQAIREFERSRREIQRCLVNICSTAETANSSCGCGMLLAKTVEIHMLNS